MWKVITKPYLRDPIEFHLIAGANSIGRSPDNDIILKDEMASRIHAILEYDSTTDRVTVIDLESTNGTYVNHERLIQPRILLPNDTISIGETTMTLVNDAHAIQQPSLQTMGTRPLTRDFLIESSDHEALLIYEVARRLNSILDLDSALHAVADLMKRAMGADKCELILSEHFDLLGEMGFPTTIAKLAIEKKAAVIIPNNEEDSNFKAGKSGSLLRVRSIMCVPILSDDEIIGLTYIYKTDPEFLPFDERDLQLAVIISHQAGLTITRTNLVKKFNNEQRIRQLFERFLSPGEVDFALDHYLKNGQLPEVAEHHATILFANIVDSTLLAEQLGAVQFSRLLESAYQEMTAAVFKNEGLVKFWGDGMLAVFGLGKNPDSPEEKAVSAGLEILERVKTLKVADGEDPFQVRIGIGTGSIMAGYMGSGERVEFTVLGDAVNIACTQESQASPDRLCIDLATLSALSQPYPCREANQIYVKGHSQLIQVYEITSENHK